PAQTVALQPAHPAVPSTAISLVPAHTTFQPTHPVVPPKVIPPGATDLISRINLRRITATVDPLGTSAEGHDDALNPFRLASATKVFGGLQLIQQHVGLLTQALQTTKLPSTLIGAIHQPDGSAAARVQIEFKPSSVG